MTATQYTQGTLPDSAPLLWSPLSGFINSIHFLLDKAILATVCVHGTVHTGRQDHALQLKPDSAVQLETGAKGTLLRANVEQLRLMSLS